MGFGRVRTADFGLVIPAIDSIAVEVDAIMDDPHALGAQPESLAHQVPVIPARRDEQVHLRRTFGQGPPTRRAMGFRQAVQERVLALQCAGDRGA